jgi:hypothetical protein
LLSQANGLRRQRSGAAGQNGSYDSLVKGRSGGQDVARLAAVLEGATGIALMIQPSLVGQLLLGDGVSGAGRALSRFAGFGLLSLGLACWPGREAGANAAGLRAMLTYSLLATLYLAYLAVGGGLIGSLLWPAMVFHAVLTILLACAWLARKRRPSVEVNPL